MNIERKWALFVHESVVKASKKISPQDWTKIDEAIKLLPENIFAGDAQKLKGEENVWRRRIGSYRLFYKLAKDEGVIIVFHLERRNSKTY